MDTGDKCVNPAIVQVLESLGKGRGGLTRSVLDRFRLLSVDTKSVLVTVAFQPNVRAVFEDLKAAGSIPQHTTLLNFYEHQRSVSRLVLPRAEMPHEEWEYGAPFQGAVEYVKSGSMVRYFHKGEFVGLVYRDSKNVLRHVDKHAKGRPWVREYRDTCWNASGVARREYFDEANKPRFRVYIDEDHRAFLSAWVTPDGYEYRTVEHAPGGSFLHGDTRAANADWLRARLCALGPAVVFTDEPRTTFALTIASGDVRHVTSIHTTHYQNNKSMADGLKQWVRFYLQNRENVDTLVFFTETQRSAFVADTGWPESRTRVIHHVAPRMVESEEEAGDRNRNCLVTVSRLAADKRIDHAIRAFAKISPRFPAAVYEIWGSGPDELRLADLVDQLGLQGKVQLRGHTSRPLDVFSSAAASVVTSKYEGFGLVMLESFSRGTPVIAYDVIYGPRDVVNSENGVLVPDGDTDALAASMARMLSSDESWCGLSRGAIETAAAFSESRWRLGWLESIRGSFIGSRAS